MLSLLTPQQMKKTGKHEQQKNMKETHIHHITAFVCLGDIQHEFRQK